MAVSNGTGQGGKTLNDRKLAADVRTLTLRKIKTILEGEDCDLQRQVILKLAATVLPRLNEHTGEDGKELPTPILYVLPHNGDQEGSKPQ